MRGGLTFSTALLGGREIIGLTRDSTLGGEGIGVVFICVCCV